MPATSRLPACRLPAPPQARVLRDARVMRSEVHDVVLVGGSTRIPKVQQLLQVRRAGQA